MKSYLADLDTASRRGCAMEAQPDRSVSIPHEAAHARPSGDSFLGAGIGSEVDEITRAFVDMWRLPSR